MKYFFSTLIVFSALFHSCSAGKGASTSDSGQTTASVETEQIQDVDDVDINIAQQELIMAEGHVRNRSREGCGYLIEVFVNNDSILVEPLHFPEMHKEDGKHVKVKYRISKRTSTCKSATPIIIDKIIG